MANFDLRSCLNRQAKLEFNDMFHEIIFEQIEFEFNFAHRQRERQKRQHDIDRENVEIERLQRQFPDQPLSIDIIFDINVDNDQNNQGNDQNNDQNPIDDEIDEYWRRRNLRYEEQQQAIDAFNAQLQQQGNQEIPFEIIDEQIPERQQPNRPLPIDEIFDIDVENIPNDNKTEQKYCNNNARKS
ncbi:hypothetical protein DERP_014316 [Dermatophagoides pteronyssinus]|uniref:Uncharacterized protein n=1 Tax=Dermatophagoides pteronyssinus TaxID=6956 RepID=A0ABQ8JWZ3_DERPT|nr:hypothetical protein DERP_014316 [Dermatophagoides pteronyssinus]